MHLIFGFAICVCLLSSASTAQDGAAAIAGEVLDSTGARVPHTKAELQSETSSAKLYRTTADDAGVYRFSSLPAGRYTLMLFSPGFLSLTVRSIEVARGQEKRIGPLRLMVTSPSCSGGPVVKYLQLLRNGTPIGNFGATVTLDVGPMKGNTPPISGADVTLISSNGKVCGATKTNQRGEFLFKGIAPGSYDLDVHAARFYPVKQLGFQVQEGIEAVYFPIHIERCPDSNCDPKLRAKKPLAICE